MMKSCRTTLCILGQLGENSRLSSGTLVKSRHRNCRFLSSDNRSKYDKYKGLPECEVKDFSMNKVVLMQKVTRYEYEKHHFREFSHDEEKFRQLLAEKGSDHEALLQRHDEYQKSLDVIYEELNKRNIEYKVIRRFNPNTSLVNWCDAIITAGGDGTFLNAASMVQGQSKPVIGINTDPLRSEGYLCLPKCYASNVGLALDKLANKEFRWKWRQRIRMILSGDNAHDDPVDLHQQQLDFPEHRFWEHVKENEEHNSGIEEGMLKPTRVLPILALNEVFIGESLSARVSFYELSIDGSSREKQKSSGLTVCTGTGSTSWFFNINHITDQSVKQILKFAQELGMCQNPSLADKALLEQLTKTFNNSLMFDPSEKAMAYCVRDPIRNAVFSVENEKGACKRMSIKSRMWDGWIVVDGGISYKFNNGAMCDFEMKPEDALRCVEM